MKVRMDIYASDLDQMSPSKRRRLAAVRLHNRNLFCDVTRFLLVYSRFILVYVRFFVRVLLA